MDRTPITVYTDGACIGNPGPGGWCAILLYNDKEKLICGGTADTVTNNRMELTAVIEAVCACKKPCTITVMADSTYVMVTNDKWKRWNQKKTQPKNWDLWQKLFDVVSAGKHKLVFRHVTAHAGVALNERCDKTAKEQAHKFAHLLAGTETARLDLMRDALAILEERSC